MGLRSRFAVEGAGFGVQDTWDATFLRSLRIAGFRRFEV